MSFFGLGGTAETANLAVNLKLNNQTTGPLHEASAGFVGLEKNVTKLGGEGFGPLGKAADGLHTMGVGALAAAGGIGAVAGVLIDSTKAAIDEQESIDRLNQSLKDNVDGWGGNTMAVEAAIKAGERLAFNADDQRNALALLVTRTHDVGKAVSLLAQAEDLARLKGVDLASAAGAIGKAYSGSYTALTKMGIAIDKNATSTEALTAVQKASAGQAEEYANSTQGALDRTSIAWHDAQVALGKGLLPVVTAAADGLIALIDNVSKVGDAFDNLHRFIDPAYAAMEDVRKGALGAAEAMGVDASALEAYIAAQQNSTQATQDGLNALIQHRRENESMATSLGVTVEEYVNAKAKQEALSGAIDAGTKSLMDYTATWRGTVDAQQEANREAEVTLRYQKTLADAAKHTASVWNDSVDRQNASTTSVTVNIRDQLIEQHRLLTAAAPAMKHAAQVVYEPIAGESAAAAKKAEAYVAAIPVLSSQKFRDGIGLVKAAMAEYKLAITQPVSKATELAAIQSALTSRKIRHGLKSHNPQIRQDTKDLVNWLIAERDRLNGTVTFRGYVSGSLSESIQKYRRDHPGDVKFPGKAAGGAVAAGGAYTVGENGPETLVMGDASGTIVPNGGASQKFVVQFQPNIVISSQAIANADSAARADHVVIAS